MPSFVFYQLWFIVLSQLLQLAEYFFLLTVEFGWRNNLKSYLQIATTVSSQVLDSLALNSENFASLITRFYFDLLLTIESFDVDECAQNGIVQWHLECAVQIISLTAKGVIGSDADVDINITRWSTSMTNLALAGQLQAQAIFDTCWNVEV